MTNFDDGEITERRSTVENSAVLEVAQELNRLDPDGTRWASVVRHTYDVIYNGRETGRYRWDQLMKTEKTHFGSLFEIFAQREFKFAAGNATDFEIRGHQVDLKWSQRDGGWMLPPEVMGHIALVATGSDESSSWSLGLVRVTPEVVRSSQNRDAKTGLSKKGRESILWLWKDAPLRPNILLSLKPEVVDEILTFRGGTRRLAALFRLVEGRVVSRGVVETLAQQLDSQKRVRSNGGAREALRDEGFIILSGQYHRRLAEALKVEIPIRDEYVPARVVPAGEDSRDFVFQGQGWRRATPQDVQVHRAPALGDKDQPTVEDGATESE